MAEAEAAVVAAVVRELTARRAYWVNVHRSGAGRNGIPDILACHRQKFLAIEVKSKTGTLRKLQAWELERVRAAGGMAVVARSVEDVRAALDEIEAMDERGVT